MKAHVTAIFEKPRAERLSYSDLFAITVIKALAVLVAIAVQHFIGVAWVHHRRRRTGLDGHMVPTNTRSRTPSTRAPATLLDEWATGIAGKLSHKSV